MPDIVDQLQQRLDFEQHDRSEHLRLADILDQMPVGIGVFDVAGQLFHANRHFDRAAGGAVQTLQMMQGAYWRALADDGSSIDEHAYPHARALGGEIATPGTNFIRRTEDGRDHFVAVSAVPLTAPGTATVKGVVVVVEEAEARMRLAARLRIKDERFRRFARHSSNALWIANTVSGELEYLSPAASRLRAGLADITTLGGWDRDVHPEDLRRVLRCRAIASAGDSQRFEYRLVDLRGDVVRHVRETTFSIPGDDIDAEDCIGAIVEDISPEVQIYLVQKAGERHDLQEELSQSARRIKRFARPEDLINVADVLNPGCVIVDLRQSLPSSGDISNMLLKRPPDLQVVFVGSQDTPVELVISAMRAGAIDYLVEPLREGALAKAVQTAVQALPTKQDIPTGDQSDLALRMDALPRREREVLQGLLSGGTNKMIGRQLGISPRTVEVHRAHLMERLNVRSLSELLQMAHRAGVGAKGR